MCAWKELWLLKASFKCEEQNHQDCLKLEDELREHEKYESKLLNLVAFKNGVTSLQWGMFQLPVRRTAALAGMEGHLDLSVGIHRNFPCNICRRCSAPVFTFV